MVLHCFEYRHGPLTEEETGLAPRYTFVYIEYCPVQNIPKLKALSLFDVKYSETKFRSWLARQGLLGNNISHPFVQTNVCYSALS